MVKLLIAEKPSLARDLSRVLGIPMAGRDGSIPAGAQAVVIPLVGHVMEVAEPHVYDPAFKAWTMKSLPILPEQFITAPTTRAKDVYRAVMKALKTGTVTEVVNACDPDREGELIFAEVFESSGVKKPSFRFWASDLTDEGIKTAWKGLKPIAEFKGVLDAAKCRQEADWKLGMNATRVMTLVMQSKGWEGKGAWSIGRVQTPTLALVVGRELEIKNFKPRTYWTVQAGFKTQAGGYPGQWFKKVDGKEVVQFDVEADAKAIMEKVRGKSGHIISVDQHDAKRGPEQFYDITALQQACNKKYGMSAAETKEIAQTLYETKKVMSYPRTDYRHITKEEEISKIPAILQALKRWPEYAPFVAQMEAAGWTGKKLGKRFVDDTKVGEHSALMPTAGAPAQLNEKEHKVFDLVVRRLLAAYFPDQVSAKTSIVTEVEKELFKTNGSVLKEPGWTAIDPMARDKSKGKGKGKAAAEPSDDDTEDGTPQDGEEEGELPPVRKGETANVGSVETKRGQTQPPPHLDEAKLLELMKFAGKLVDDEELADAMMECGLGTGATRDATIEKLIYQQYIVRQKKLLMPTPKGFDLIAKIPVEALKSPSLTGQWEQKLNLMAKNAYSRATFTKEIDSWIRELVTTFKKDAVGGGESHEGHASFEQFEARPAGTCPKCKKAEMVLKQWKGQFYVQCPTEKCCSYNTDKDGKPLATCKHCHGPVKSGIAKVSKKPYAICVLCSQFQDGPGHGASTGNSPSTSAPTVSVGKCIVCGKGNLNLREWQGEHYVKCDAEGCNTSYNTDKTGKPKKKCAYCKGPVKFGQSMKTGKNYAICVSCKKFQDDPKKSSPALAKKS